MSTHNICFCREIKKYVDTLLSVAMLFIIILPTSQYDINNVEREVNSKSSSSSTSFVLVKVRLPFCLMCHQDM